MTLPCEAISSGVGVCRGQPIEQGRLFGWCVGIGGHALCHALRGLGDGGLDPLPLDTSTLKY